MNIILQRKNRKFFLKKKINFIMILCIFKYIVFNDSGDHLNIIKSREVVILIKINIYKNSDK